jgi:proteasome beta subunit
VAIQSLIDAADDDSATGGPDMLRRIFPVIGVVTADGYRRLPEDEVATLVDAAWSQRHQRPDGPAASLT